MIFNYLRFPVYNSFIKNGKSEEKKKLPCMYVTSGIQRSEINKKTQKYLVIQPFHQDKKGKKGIFETSQSSVKKRSPWPIISWLPKENQWLVIVTENAQSTCMSANRSVSITMTSTLLQYTNHRHFEHGRVIPIGSRM